MTQIMRFGLIALTLALSSCASKQDLPRIVFVPKPIELPADLREVPVEPIKPALEGRKNGPMGIYLKEHEDYANRLRELVFNIYFYIDSEKP